MCSEVGAIMDSDTSGSESDHQDTQVKDELVDYLKLQQMKFKNDWGVLDWWRDNQSTYPNLAVMARQYLGCPATSAAVERLFSNVGHAFSKNRKKAKADTLKDIMFALENV